MTMNRSQFLRRPLRAATLALAATWLGATAGAAPLPSAGRLVKMEARDQPIDQFLGDAMAQIDVPVSASSSLQGLVNGSFALGADRLLRDMSRAYNLVSYFDGAVLHVAPANELVTRSFSMPPASAQQIQKTAAELQMTDARNTLRSTRDGTLVAVGVRRYVQQVEELVRQARPPAAGPAAGPGNVAWTQPLLDYRIFYLRYAWAQDVVTSFAGRQTVVPGVANILRALVGASQRGPGASSAPRGSTQPKLRGQGLARGGSGLGTLGYSDSAVGGGSGNSVDALLAALGSNNVGAPAVEPAAAGPTAPDGGSFVRIEADPRLNAVIVRDLPERLPRYAELVSALDVEPQALEIEATIIDINTDRMRELGINWRWNRGLSSLMFGNGTASDLRLKGDQDPTPSGAGGTISAVLGDSKKFVARISALQAEGAAKVVSSPQVVTLSNVEAVFDNSSTFYVRVAGRDDVDLFNVTAGTTLRVTPHVFKDGDATRIKLLVNIEDGALTQQLVDTLPVVERSAVNTQALIAEGESLLIGGMVRDSARSGEDKVPVLGDVPLLGHLFKTTTSGQARVERLFLISPRLASTRTAASANERARLPVDALQKR
jgi:type III secretion protein C